MRFERTERFDKDVKALPREHREQFRHVVPQFHAACEGYTADPGGFVWPAALRVRQMAGARGVWEMTWSYASPDGRATFEFVTRDGERRVLWRRIGRHEIFREP
jgi:hypothetical protein